MSKFWNQSSYTPIESSRRVGTESRTGWPETHLLNFNEQKGSESLLLNAEATLENPGMHTAKR